MTDTMSRTGTPPATDTYPDITEPFPSVDPAIIAEIDAIEEDDEISEGTLPTPTLQQCIEAIICETNCDRATAELVDDFWATAVYANRNQSFDHLELGLFDGVIFRGTYHLGDKDLQLVHPVLDIIAPDDHLSERGNGTAHDLLDRRHCDPGLGERGLVHSKTDGEIRNCYVYVDLVVID